ncbi:MAG: acyltransferase [Cyanobacteria bacterium SBLK]|nr:acyltransferase [Cyanobacteria bacterium SBLK]
MSENIAKNYIDDFDLKGENFLRVEADFFKLLINIFREFFKIRKRSILKRDIKLLFNRQGVTIKNSSNGENNCVYSKDKIIQAKIEIDFERNARGCKIYLGKNLRGNINIKVRNRDSIIYIGNKCSLNNLEIVSSQDDDKIIIGNFVTTSYVDGYITRFLSGGYAGNITPYLIIGDGCMLSSGITIRNIDGHPIFSYADNTQTNTSKTGVLVEPHVWIGQDVKILKDVTIGVGSIIGTGAIVTKNVPPLSIALGIPASCRKLENQFWAHSNTEESKEAAKNIIEKYLKSPISSN